MIRFSCPKCGKHLKAPAHYAGKQVKCSRCAFSMPTPAAASRPGKTWLEPPEVVDLDDTLPLGVPPTKPASEPASAKRHANSRRVAALCVGGGLLLIGLVGLIVFLSTPSTLDQNLKDLKSNDRNTSTQALQWLAEADPTDAQRASVTAALETLLFDGDVNKNLNPDIVLHVYLTWANKDNVPAMSRMVQNPTMPAWSLKKSGQVMEALARIQDERAIAALAERLSDPVLHNQAINGLKVIGPKAEKTVLNYVFSDDVITRQRANSLLAEYGTQPKVIVAEAFDRLNSTQADVRRSALVWFVENAPDDDGRKARGGKLLATLLGDSSPDVCKQVLEALKSWGTKECLPDLVEYARREQKTNAGNPLLIEVLARFPDETAAEGIAMQLPNANTRAEAAKALLKLGPVSTKAVLEYLNHPKAEVEKEARSLCRLLKISDERQLEQTLADVADSRIPRCLAALRNLAHLRQDEASRAKVSKALNAALVEPHKEISAEALNAVTVWRSKENTATLLKMLGPFNKAGMGRNARIIEVLGEVKDPRAVPTLVLGLAHPRERELVSKALMSIGSPAEDAVAPYLDSPGAARFEACRILGEIGTSKSLDPLQKAYDQAGGDLDFSRALQVAMQKIMVRN